MLFGGGLTGGSNVQITILKIQAAVSLETCVLQTNRLKISFLVCV